MIDAMFEERPSIEGEQDRSIRHARMVREAAFFCVGMIVFVAAFGAGGMWLSYGYVDIDLLLFTIGLVSIVLPIGMFFELRKRW
ncbi:hypothetical protein [Terricaulis silvestris]|uniref:Uncharacterized protein n=1 Tax=Terricaulis silvestris TaxID=2686094 RepID=A0A6I6MGP8_9CAUL|nr:hypothetical protein [Terricaulis silvestris]QGZ93895.1 hypothetical protein DSM104635_00709 [Terricaulis silvestris]